MTTDIDIKARDIARHSIWEWLPTVSGSDDSFYSELWNIRWYLDDDTDDGVGFVLSTDGVILQLSEELSLANIVTLIDETIRLVHFRDLKLKEGK